MIIETYDGEIAVTFRGWTLFLTADRQHAFWKPDGRGYVDVVVGRA